MAGVRLENLLTIQTDFFFDRAIVERAKDRGRVRALSSIGAWIRKTAQRSLRFRKGASAPGRPPHSHEGTLRRLILFSYDPSNESVIIGPIARPGKGLVGGQTVPELLEEGGYATIERKVLRGRAPNRRKVTVTKRVLYKPRAFMGPALAKARASRRLTTAWRDVIR